MTTTFIGIDLAWKVDSNHTGCAVLEGNGREARFLALSADVGSMRGVVDFIEKHATANTVVAVDAPLIVINETGQRLCETRVGQRFGRFGASCHSTNLSRNPRPAGARLVAALSGLGFRHDLDLSRAKGQSGRWIFEVYPHPAMIVLFGLERIIRYKKGSVADKRRGLKQLQALLLTLTRNGGALVETDDFRRLCDQDVEELAGRALKHYEDSLDAAFCAYLAFHCWLWGDARNEMFGDLEAGYIVVPTVPSSLASEPPSRFYRGQ